MHSDKMQNNKEAHSYHTHKLYFKNMVYNVFKEKIQRESVKGQF